MSLTQGAGSERKEVGVLHQNIHGRIGRTTQAHVTSGSNRP